MRRMVSLIRQIGNDSGDSPTECGPDVQKRLQRMLEETLTKNMHLTVNLIACPISFLNIVDLVVEFSIFHLVQIAYVKCNTLN